MRIILLLTSLFFCSGSLVIAQNAGADAEIKQTITTFFDGLHHGDSILVKKAISQDIKMQTTYVNKDGKDILKTQSKDAFLKAIASKKSEDTWEEKLLSYDIQIDANLASVWTPYEFYVNGSFSHCGTNSFQLFNDNGQWKIIYIVDTRKRNGCNTNK